MNKFFLWIGMTDDMENDLTGLIDDKQEDFWKLNITRRIWLQKIYTS